MPAPDALTAAMDDLERRVRVGAKSSRLNLESLYPEAWRDSEAAVELAYAEYALRRAQGEEPDRGEWLRAYPQWAERFERLFGLYDLMTDRDTGDGRADRTFPGRDDEPVPITGPPGYCVHEELGRGGMAVVYRATQVALNRPVALKVLRGGAWVEVADAARLRREAEIVAKLRHPNVVPIYESGEWDGTPYLTLEYVPGGTLADDLSRRRDRGEDPPRASVSARLVETLARAVHAAHGEGVVHRDLKPANVLLAGPSHDRFATPQISDFGLAINGSTSASVTHTRTLSGTPSYMAPEQTRGHRNEIGPRSDVYSLGAILYELLTGRPPHEGPTVLDTLDRVRHVEPKSPRSIRPDVPRDLETVCLKALAKDPARRYGSALAFADDLRRVLDGKPIAARPVRWPERAWKRVRRHPVVSGLATALLIATAAAAGLYDAKGRQVKVNERENARLADEARVAEAIAAAKSHWTSGRLPDARVALISLEERLRTEEWRELYRLSSALVATHEITQWQSWRLYPYSGSEDNRHVLLAPSGQGGTTCHVVDIETGRIVKSQGLLSFVRLAAMGRGTSVVMIPALKSAGIYANLKKKQPEPIVKYWDLAANKPISVVRVESIDPIPSENGLFVFQTQPKKTSADLHDVASGRVVATLRIPASRNTNAFFRIGPGGRHVVDVDLKTWTIYPTADPDRPFPVTHDEDTSARFEALGPDDRTLYWTEAKLRPSPGEATVMKTLVAYDLETRSVRYRRPIDPFPQLLVLSPDGRWFVVSRGESVSLYATNDGSHVVTLYGHPEYPKTLAFSRDGRTLFTKSQFTLKVWDLSPWTSRNPKSPGSPPKS